MIGLGALFVGAIAVFLANAYLTGVEERAETLAEEQQLARIVVATQELGFGDALTPENVRLQNFPANSVPTGAFRDINAALANNRVALRPIVPGEPILASKVSGADGRAVLAANLPEGMRAVSIQVSAVTGVSGFVRPGDTVDVILTRKIPGAGAEAQDMMSDIILDRVKVLAIDQVANEGATEPQVGQTAVLEVEPFQAQQLAIAGKLGTLSLALRNIESDEATEGQTVTNRNIGSRLYIAERPRRQGGAQQPQVQTAVVAAGTAAQLGATITGPSMTVFRGVEAETYPVGRRGGDRR